MHEKKHVTCDSTHGGTCSSRRCGLPVVASKTQQQAQLRRCPSAAMQVHVCKACLNMQICILTIGSWLAFVCMYVPPACCTLRHCRACPQKCCIGVVLASSQPSSALPTGMTKDKCKYRLFRMALYDHFFSHCHSTFAHVQGHTHLPDNHSYTAVAAGPYLPVQPAAQLWPVKLQKTAETILQEHDMKQAEKEAAGTGVV